MGGKYTLWPLPPGWTFFSTSLNLLVSNFQAMRPSIANCRSMQIQNPWSASLNVASNLRVNSRSEQVWDRNSELWTAIRHSRFAYVLIVHVLLTHQTTTHEVSRQRFWRESQLKQKMCRHLISGRWGRELVLEGQTFRVWNSYFFKRSVHSTSGKHGLDKETFYKELGIVANKKFPSADER